jgi:hypothetical protein
MSKLDGLWNFTVKTYMGDYRFRTEFKVEGNTLTGSNIDISNGNTFKIKSGSVDGDNFSYKVQVKIPIGKLNIVMDGKINADGTLSGTSENEMGEFDFTASRV